MDPMQNYAASLLEALEFAAEKHRDQRRKGVEASPYINHPIQVAELLARVGGVTDLATLQAAILHDTIEDTDTSRKDLQQQFGEQVSALVAEVTDDRTLPKAQRKKLQIEHARHMSDAARQIKIADKTCNVRDVASRPPANWDEDRRREYLDWAEKVVDGCRGANGALEACFDQSLAAGRSKLFNEA